MPQLIYDVQFKIDQSSLGSLKNIVDSSTTAEVSSLTDKVQKLEAELSKLKNTQAGVNKTDQKRIKQSQTRQSQIRAILQVEKIKGKLTDDQIKKLRTLVDAEEKEGNQMLENSFIEKKSLSAKKQLSDQYSRSSAAVANATEVLEHYEQQQEKTNATVKGGAKSFSIANQTLFGFGDLAQDASQFSQGFAQGMRAIGNNIAFNAEMFGTLVQKTGSAKEAFKALGSQMLGTGGIILGINILVMAATTLLTKFGKSSKEASSAVDDFISSSADLRGTSGFDFLNIDSLERQQKALSRLIPVIEDVDKAQNGLKRNVTILGRSMGMASSSALGTRDALVDQSKIVDKLRDKFGDLSDIELVSLLEKMTELNAELALRKALLEADPLAKFILETSKATEKVLIFAEAELGLKDALDQRRKDLEKLIQQEINSGLATDESIARYKVLKEQLSEVNSELRKQNDELFRRNQFIQDTKTKLAETRFVEDQIKNIGRRDKREELSLKSRMDRFNIELQSQSEIAKINHQYANEEIDDALKNSRTKAIIAERDMNLLRVDAEEKAANQQITRDNIKEGLEIAGKFTSGFASLKQQELQSELQAAKARGASAKEIEKIQRKQFEVDKKAQLAKAVINTASAVTEALPNVPKSILMGALGAIQIAKILQTKFGGGGATSAGATTTGRGGGASNIMTTTGSDRPTSINRSLSSFNRSDSNSFFPSSRNGGAAFNVTVVNTFDERTVASVNKAGEERRRSSAISAI